MSSIPSNPNPLKRENSGNPNSGRSRKKCRVEDERSAFEKLPPEILCQIKSYLPNDLENLNATSRTLRAVALDQGSLWKRRVEVKLGSRALFHFSPLVQQGLTSWEKVLKNISPKLLDLLDVFIKNGVASKNSDFFSKFQIFYGQWRCRFSYGEDGIEIFDTISQQTNRLTIGKKILSLQAAGDCLFALAMDDSGKAFIEKWNFQKLECELSKSLGVKKITDFSLKKIVKDTVYLSYSEFLGIELHHKLKKFNLEEEGEILLERTIPVPFCSLASQIVYNNNNVFLGQGWNKATIYDLQTETLIASFDLPPCREQTKANVFLAMCMGDKEELYIRSSRSELIVIKDSESPPVVFSNFFHWYEPGLAYLSPNTLVYPTKYKEGYGLEIVTFDGHGKTRRKFFQMLDKQEGNIKSEVLANFITALEEAKKPKSMLSALISLQVPSFASISGLCSAALSVWRN